MSNIYQTYDSSLNNYETPSDGVGSVGRTDRDIDQELAYVGSDVNGNPQNFYDYDIKLTPSVSGPQLIVPSSPDDGIPNFSDSSLFSSESMGDIIDTVNNGRVHDISVRNKPLISSESDIVINKDNKETSVKGVIEQTSLSDIFFSEMNMDVLQKSIRYKVFSFTDKVIDNQPENTLYIIMRSIMLQYANFSVSTENLLDEIRSLNQRVIDYSAENISSNVQQYMGYLNDIEKLPVPMERPSYQNKNNFTYDISNLL